MNAKFYVPFETAKLLKKAGYPQSGSDMYYDLSNNLTPDNGFIPIDDDVCAAAPAYCEVLDWLTLSKEIYIDVNCVSKHRWYCYTRYNHGKSESTCLYSTREEAINSAIVETLEEMI